jgi:AraC family transcriptional activator of pobA
MKKIIQVESVSTYDKLRGVETRHPLVNTVDYVLDNASYLPGGEYNLGLYSVALKEVKCGDIRYGRETYDYQEGTLAFMAPGQVFDLEDTPPNFSPKGKLFYFHPDLIHGTSLGKHIHEYSFFSYESREALHLSEQEKKIILECFANIKYELEHATDKHSKTLVVNNIELCLNYCKRFYDRQFITREHVNSRVLNRFEILLNDYFYSDKPQTLGFPLVIYFAEELNLSANYFGDLIKKETGKSPQEYIQLKLINVAKEKIFDQSKSISEISFELGFKYPQHFTRMFKKQLGISPAEYRLMSN